MHKMAPSWSRDEPSWAHDGHLEVIWKAIPTILKRQGDDLCKNGRCVKMSVTMAFWPQMEVLGGLVGGSWGVFWAILVTSWALLGDVGVKLETFWQKVETKMAEDGLRSPT